MRHHSGVAQAYIILTPLDRWDYQTFIGGEHLRGHNDVATEKSNHRQPGRDQHLRPASPEATVDREPSREDHKTCVKQIRAHVERWNDEITETEQPSEKSQGSRYQ
ncbi:hypothetical protein A3K78_07690 [Candidatus Bathyarchaeota archaeon RBG_13_52_12]|nr:MAG: hypothetical protein A3K78_07690 [Candidatus Bathyarchaeota archaeon RBG_13_52_12]